MSNNEISGDNKTGKIKPPAKQADEHCNARIGESYCTDVAGFGTQHLGSGRCRLHGGLSSGRPPKSFSAAEFLNSDIIKTFEETADLDPASLTNLDNEITVLRSSFYDYLKKCLEEKKTPHPDHLKKYSDSLCKIVELKSKLEGKINTSKVPTHVIFCYINNITAILKKHITDQDLMKRIALDMKNISLESNDDSSERS